MSSYRLQTKCFTTEHCGWELIAHSHAQKTHYGREPCVLPGILCNIKGILVAQCASAIQAIDMMRVLLVDHLALSALATSEKAPHKVLQKRSAFVN